MLRSSRPGNTARTSCLRPHEPMCSCGQWPVFSAQFDQPAYIQALAKITMRDTNRADACNYVIA